MLENLEFGGTQTQVLELLRRLRRADMTVELWVLCARGEERRRTADLPVRVLSGAPGAGAASMLRFWKLLRRHRPDVLIPFTVVPNIWGRILGRLAKVPAIIGNCRGGGAPGRQKEYWLHRLADAVVCNCTHLQARLARLGVPAQKLAVIHNGVDLDRFRPVAGRGPGKRLLHIGRMVEDKDQALVLRSLALLPGDYSLTIVGEGPLESSLKEEATRLGLGRRVRFLAPVEEVESLYGMADLFVLTSRREAFPNVLAEALATGMPVVTVRVGGAEEVLGEEPCGVLARRRTPEAVAEAIVRLGSPERYAECAAAAVRRSSQLSLATMAMRYEELIRRLAAARRGGP